MSLRSFLAAAGHGLSPRFDALVQAEYAAQPLAPAAALQAADLGHLPPPVRRYVLSSGAVGRPRPQRMTIAFDALMSKRAGARPMVATSVQHSFFGRSTRLFFMRARMAGLPVQVLHAYLREEATMRVRVASLVNVVDLAGEMLSRAETVTVLNDLCLMAPGALGDPHLAWTPRDERSAGVSFTNGRHRVAAVLSFNARDELVDFASDDRPALQGDGTLRPLRWSTPVDEYQVLDGLRLPSRARAVYAYPEGEHAYGIFTVRSVAHDQPAPPAG